MSDLRRLFSTGWLARREVVPLPLYCILNSDQPVNGSVEDNGSGRNAASFGSLNKWQLKWGVRGGKLRRGFSQAKSF